ncbi:MAG: type II toxin-antitoxin system HicA family toxin [Chloroflexi bacterium]|nr:type II toxin-antitoxin system HicA family toxin [Chloroflexota bacterium]
MGQIEKLIRQLVSRPTSMDFDDVCRVLAHHGWVLDRTKGHPVFVKKGEFPITVALVSGRKVKRVYLKQICERLGLEED